MARTSFVDVALRLRGARRFSAEVAAASKQLDAMGVKGAMALGGFAQKAERFKSVGRSLTTSLTLPIAAVGGASVYAAMKWESAFAGVEKTVDATEPQLAKLNDQLIAMSMNIPVSATELAEIGEAAGQLGIQTNNIARFTEVMANLGVATNMSSTEAAEQLARFANITQMPQSEFERLGSTIVDLGNNLAATETDIVGMGLRIAAAGNQIGLTEAEIMGFAGALSSVGVRAEAGGTAISTAFLEANSAVIQGGEDLQKWAQVAGVSAGDFRKKWNANAGLAMTEFLEGLNKVEDQKAVLEGLGLSGIRVRDILSRAAGAGDLLRESLALGNKAWRENQALQDEANKRYKTFESRLQILKNTLFAVGVIVGDALLPPLLDLVNFIAPKLLAVAKWFRGLPKPIKTAAVGALLLLAALGPMIWMLGVFAKSVGAILIILPKLIVFLKAVALRMAILNLVMSLNPISLIVIGIVVLIGVLVLAYKKIGWFRKGVDAAFKWIKNAAVSGSQGVVAAVKWIASAATNTRNWVVNAFNNVVAFFKGLPGRIRSAASGMFDGIKDAFSSAIDFIIQKWESLKNIGGGVFGSIADIAGSVVPGAADGATITRPGTVMVGERGPELLSLPRGASVIPLSPALRAAGGAQRIEVPVYLNGRQIALAVAGEVADAKARR